jgi:hypothetical protein
MFKIQNISRYQLNTNAVLDHEGIKHFTKIYCIASLREVLRKCIRLLLLVGLGGLSIKFDF